MTRPHDYQTEAIVIKKTKLGEADRILTFYTPTMGRIQGVAKGVRKPKSKLAGHVELLTHSTIQLQRGRGSLDTVTGAQTVNGFLPLKNDLLLSAYGLYCTELVNQFTVDDAEDETVFRLLVDTLTNLCETINRDLLLRWFEIKLLAAMGFQPQLRECVLCHKPLEPVVNSFSAATGGTLCPFCAPKQPFASEITVNALKVLRFIQDNDYPTVSRLTITNQLARELEAITRHYLKYHLDRDVRSVAWLDEVREHLKKPLIPLPAPTPSNPSYTGQIPNIGQ